MSCLKCPSLRSSPHESFPFVLMLSTSGSLLFQYFALVQNSVINFKSLFIPWFIDFLLSNILPSWVPRLFGLSLAAGRACCLAYLQFPKSPLSQVCFCQRFLPFPNPFLSLSGCGFAFGHRPLASYFSSVCSLLLPLILGIIHVFVALAMPSVSVSCIVQPALLLHTFLPILSAPSSSHMSSTWDSYSLFLFLRCPICVLSNSCMKCLTTMPLHVDLHQWVPPHFLEKKKKLQPRDAQKRTPKKKSTNLKSSHRKGRTTSIRNTDFMEQQTPEKTCATFRNATIGNYITNHRPWNWASDQQQQFMSNLYSWLWNHSLPYRKVFQKIQLNASSSSLNGSTQPSSIKVTRKSIDIAEANYNIRASRKLKQQRWRQEWRHGHTSPACTEELERQPCVASTNGNGATEPRYTST